MSQKPYLTSELRTAEPGNVRLVYAADRPQPVGRHYLETAVNLRRKQAFAEELGTQATLREAQVESPEDNTYVTGWDGLAERTAQWVSTYVGTRDFSEYARLTADTPEESMRHVQRVASEGVATTAAFLEVIGKVLAGKDFEDPNEAIAAIAKRSQGLILDWTGVHGRVDRALAAALASPKPRDINSAVFRDLHFDARWFTEDEGRIILDPAKFDQLAFRVVKKPHNPRYPTKVKHKHPKVEDDRRQVLFGCPGRHMVPYIYKKMVEDATANGLFGQTYQAERSEQSVTELTAV